MSDARVKFQGLLRELFQFDCADLDFGIYRIMNQKRGVIDEFINTNPHGEGGERSVCVIWRDVTGWTATDFKADAAFVKEEKLGHGADEVFVNADSVIPGTHVLDGVFKERMFAPVAL